ncbi:McbB family protein [Macrococcoides caseolyticum]|nr:McbB family protein [Macrococcus caseolyticus]RKO14002.1 McbB family protein [Macrococcus caseolyticus]
MTSIYKVKTYLIYNLSDSEVVVQNHLGIVRINEKRMIDFLYYLEREVLRRVTKSEIKSRFGADTDQAIKFLEENKILSNITEIEFNFDRVFIFSNEEEVLSYLTQVIVDKDINVISGDVEQLKSHELNDSLILIFQNPYSKKKSRKILEYIDLFENNILIMSYIYNNVFYIDNIYSKELNNPCHFCNIGFIESKIRSIQDEQISYQDLIDQIYEIDDEFEVNHPISNINKLKISIHLYDFINKYLDNNRKLSSKEILDCFKLDLNNETTMFDTAIHWELCDCYE